MTLALWLEFFLVHEGHHLNVVWHTEKSGKYSFVHVGINMPSIFASLSHCSLSGRSGSYRQAL
jgi:hydrogenase maturation factor